MRPDLAPVMATVLAPTSASALAPVTAAAPATASASAPAPTTAEGFAFDDAALGRGMSAEVEALITRAGQLPHDPAQAEALLREAVALAPTHPAPLISLYRFHFYGHRLAQALAVADHALGVARAALVAQHGPQFGQVPPAPEDARHDAAVRFYLFTLKGQAYLSLRLGRVDAGRAALAELRRLDPQDCVGGGVLSKVLLRQGREDDGGDGDASALPETPRGWAEEPL
jgi:hypothetical protein